MSPNYRAYARGVRELHQLLAVGKDDSPEADAIRGATDGPWEGLSEVERERVGNLSEDLYSLIEPPPAVQPMTAQAQDDLNQAFEARQRGEWDRALDLIRRCVESMSPDVVSFFRGRTWLDAGDADTAVLFFEHAARLQPENGNYLAVFLYALEKVDPKAAQTRAEIVLQDPDRTTPAAVVRAADIVCRASRSLPEAEAGRQYRRLIPILEHALARFDADGVAVLDRLHFGIATLLLGSCHELLGNTQAAVNSLARGLRLDPDNPSLLGTRGVMQYGTSPQAVSDLELAVRNGSAEVWPFYFLAHHYLLTGRFEECRRLCERMLTLDGSSAMMSEVCEWMAIAQAELGFPAQMVRDSFENAIRFDSSNERAKRHLAAFEVASKSITVKNWEIRSTGAVRTWGLAERRFAVAA
jgi:tetratricopeptide (TPR) repeat protein